MSAELITFGKYKGQPVEVLANDKKYTDWLMAQEWFRTGHIQLYNVIVNNFCEPSDTPEHNRMQADFMKTEVKEKVITQLIKEPEELMKGYKKRIEDCDERISDIELQITELQKEKEEHEVKEKEFSDLEKKEHEEHKDEIEYLKNKCAEYRKMCNNPYLMSRSYDDWKTSNYSQTKLEKEEYEEIQQKYNECESKIDKLNEPENKYRNKKWEISNKIRDIDSSIKTLSKKQSKVLGKKSYLNKLYEKLKNNGFVIEKTTFEVNGWDVYIHLGFPYNANIFLELKPSVGDDYPSVLREMKVHKNHMSRSKDVIYKDYYDDYDKYGRCGRVITKDCYILVYKNLTTSTISESELAEYFNSCDFEVVKI